MRRTWMIPLAVALLLLQEVAASAAPPPQPPPEHVSGKSSVPGSLVTLSANGDPTSGAATGTVTNHWPQGLVYEVRVTCMTVVDNRASVGGEIIASAVFPGHVGSGLVVTIADNTASGLPDQMGHSLSDVPRPLPGATCPIPSLMGPDFNIERGNFQVTGGSTLAATVSEASQPISVASAGP